MAGAWTLLAAPGPGQCLAPTARSAVVEPGAGPVSPPGLAASAGSGASGAVRTLSLDEALAIGFSRAWPLKLREADEGRVRAAADQVDAGYWPTLSASSRVETTRSPQGALQVQLDRQRDLVVAPGFTDFDSTGTTITGALTLGYDFDLGGGLAGRTAIAREQVAIAALEIRKARRSLRFEIKNAYLGLQEAQEEVRISALARGSARTTQEDTRKLTTGGEATVFDQQQARIQVLLAEQSLIESRRRQETAWRSLARVLALPPDTPLAASDPVSAGPAGHFGPEEAVDRAIRNRPEPAAHEAARRIAGHQGQVARAGYWPRPQVFLTGDTTAFPQPGGGAPEALGRLGPGFGFSAGAGFQWPLFDGFAAQASVRQSEIAAAAARIRLEESLADIRQEVETAFADLAAFGDTIRTADQTVALANQGLESARKRFHAGFGTQTDVILAIESVNKAESQRTKAILGLNRSLAALERATGDGD